MTVQELIHYIENCPPNMQVYIPDRNDIEAFKDIDEVGISTFYDTIYLR